MDKILASDASGRIRGLIGRRQRGVRAGLARDRRGPARHFPLAGLMLQVITTPKKEVLIFIVRGAGSNTILVLGSPVLS
jgi:hypothetical protein